MRERAYIVNIQYNTTFVFFFVQLKNTSSFRCFVQRDQDERAIATKDRQSCIGMVRMIDSNSK